MAMQVKVELHKDGIIALLKSPGVLKDMERRGQNVADAAGSEDFESRAWLGFDRARATVRPSTYEGRRAESEDKRLTSSIDAARQ